MSQPENVFDLAGVFPLKMHVVGVLKPTGTPDDRAVFVDVKTAWIIEGLGHGHDKVSQPQGESRLLSQDSSPPVTHASAMKFNEITAENAASFHFHGEQESFPLTAVIAVPHDEKSGTLLEGRYLGDDEMVQIVRPRAVMRDLLRTVVTVQRYVIVAAIVIGFATLAIVAMVFVLSFQLRRREIETMIKIGGTRVRIASLITVEIVGVLATGIVSACVLSLATGWFASSMTRLLIQLS